MTAALKAETRAYFRMLGAHIGELRKEQGMTQAELARALGVSQQTVFAYELGDRRVSVLILVKLSTVFDVPLEEMAGMKKPIRPKLRLSPAGMRHATRFQALPRVQQRFVKKIIDVLLEKNSPRLSIAPNGSNPAVSQTAPVLTAGAFRCAAIPEKIVPVTSDRDMSSNKTF